MNLNMPWILLCLSSYCCRTYIIMLTSGIITGKCFYILKWKHNSNVEDFWIVQKYWEWRAYWFICVAWGNMILHNFKWSVQKWIERKKPVPKKPADEGCNSEALRSISSEYTVKVQNSQASSLLFTVWELMLSGSYSPQKGRRMDPATNWDN